MEFYQSNEKEMSEIKEIYSKHQDNIRIKRFESPLLIRRYIHGTEYQTILNYAQGLKPKTILDFGCGDGVLSLLLAGYGFKVTALDISESNIKIASAISKRNNLDINFITGDCEKTQLPNKSFDLIIAAQILEHLPDMIKGLQEIKRLSNKAIISVPTCLGLSSIVLLGNDTPWRITAKSPLAPFKGLIRVISNYKKDAVIESYGGNSKLPHPWFYPWKFKRILENNGFRVLKIAAASLCPPYISWLFPRSIKLVEVIDRFKDKKILNYLGYGTIFIVEVVK